MLRVVQVRDDDAEARSACSHGPVCWSTSRTSAGTRADPAKREPRAGCKRVGEENDVAGASFLLTDHGTGYKQQHVHTERGVTDARAAEERPGCDDPGGETRKAQDR